jgi:diguanylate cyclase (GGDEF)-like protein
LSCFLVSALLFSGIYFYVKGFMESRGIEQSHVTFNHAERHLRALLRGRNASITDLAQELDSPVVRAELNAAGLNFVAFRKGHPISFGLTLTTKDEKNLKEPPLGETVLLTLNHNRYLVRSVEGHTDSLLLYPLSEIDNSSRELLEAFWVAGAALLVLTMVLAKIISSEISRPLILLRNRVRAMAEAIGLEPPQNDGDEVGEIAASYLDFTQHLQDAYEHKNLAIDELEAYRAELLRVNSSLQRRLFQVKVLLSLWSERDKAVDVKDFLSRFLSALLPGLPFEFGCVIIRPIADMGSETIFATKIPGTSSKDHSEEEAGTMRSEILDPDIKEFLLREGTNCRESRAVRISSVRGRVRKSAEPTILTVLSIQLKQGTDPLGSMHFLTEQESPLISRTLSEFLLNLCTQVSAQLQIQALSYATRLDPLTRLYNRGFLNDRLREEIVRWSRKQDPFSVVLLDIDHFPQVNGEHGQQAADELLRGVSSLLRTSCRGSDAVCRFSGSVLAIVLAGTAGAGAKIFAENVRRSVENREFEIPNGSIKITVSLGIAEFPQAGNGIEAILTAAELALANAKDAGRNTWKSAA